MATPFFFDGFTTLDLQTTEATPTATPVAGIQNVAVTPSLSIENLYTADSGKVEAKNQHGYSVGVSIGYSKFDATFVEQWLGGGGGTSATSWTDTNNPQEFELSATFVGDDGTTLDWTVTGITFEEIPLTDGSQGEYVQWDLEGEGTDVTNFATV